MNTQTNFASPDINVALEQWVNKAWFIPAYRFLTTPANHQHSSWWGDFFCPKTWRNLKRYPHAFKTLNTHLLSELENVTLADLAWFEQPFPRLLLASGKAWRQYLLRLGLRANQKHLRICIDSKSQQRIIKAVGANLYRQVLTSASLTTNILETRAVQEPPAFDMDSDIRRNLMTTGCRFVGTVLVQLPDGIVQRFVRKLEKSYGEIILQTAKSPGEDWHQQEPSSIAQKQQTMIAFLAGSAHPQAELNG